MRPSRGMGSMKKDKLPGGKVCLKAGGIPKRHEPPKKPAPPRLDRALKKYKPKIPPTEFT